MRCERRAVDGAWAGRFELGEGDRAPRGEGGQNGRRAAAARTSFKDDHVALERTVERVEGPVVLAGHADAGAVIGATRSEKVKALAYIAALAPDEGETVVDVFYRGAPHPDPGNLRAGRGWADLLLP